MREFLLSKKLINKLSVECFDMTPTDKEIQKIYETFDDDLERCGGILYIGDVCDIIGEVLSK